ncbi:MAG: hypothetical protein ACRDPR_14440 [Nocardioidaceae bacterium]
MTGSNMRTLRTLAPVIVAALVLASCADGGGSEEPAASASPSPSSTVKVPEAVELTEVGAALSFGDTATVIHEPDQKRGTVLDLTVKKVVKGTTADFSGFILDDYTRSATPYYVTVTVKNVGEGDVGGGPVPVWGVDAENTLLPPASFTTTFRRCPSEPLPKAFAQGKTFATCLVFLAPDKGTMEAVSYRPNQEFDPIEWTGEIVTPAPEPKKTERPKRKKSNRG